MVGILTSLSRYQNTFKNKNHSAHFTVLNLKRKKKSTFSLNFVIYTNTDGELIDEERFETTYFLQTILCVCEYVKPVKMLGRIERGTRAGEHISQLFTSS